MNCYDFELKISAYIDGELKQTVRNIFVKHKDNCQNCNKKLSEISKLMEELPSLTKLNTSDKFEHNLHKKIHA